MVEVAREKEALRERKVVVRGVEGRDCAVIPGVGRRGLRVIVMEEEEVMGASEVGAEKRGARAGRWRGRVYCGGRKC